MTFLHSILAVAAAISVAIPIIIHLLLRRRRRPIPWGAMRFLIEAYKKQRRKLKLQQLILLATRCLVIALAGFAIARPLLSGAGLTGGSTGRLVVLLIDDSLASSARGADGAVALDGLKKEARGVLGALGAGDRVALVTLGAPARAVVSPPSTDIGAVRELIDGLTPTDSGSDIAGGLTLAGETIAREGEKGGRSPTVVVLSGFTGGSAALSRPLPPALAELTDVRLIASPPSGEAADNVRIVSVEPLRSVLLTRGGASPEVQAQVTLERSGGGVGQSAVTTVRVNVASGVEPPAGQPVAAVVRWSPGETRASVVVRGLTAPGDEAVQSGGVIIAAIDRDAVAGDNEFQRPVGVRDVLRVGVVAQRRFGRGPGIARLDPGDWYRLALQPSGDAPVEVTDIEPSSIDASVLSALDAVFVPSPDLVRDDGWDRLAGFAERGGLVVVSPPAEASVHLWTDSFVEAFGLDWRLAREPVAFAADDAAAKRTLSAPVGGSAGGGESDGVLSMLREEIDSLARPVGIEKWLPFEEPPAGARVLLTLGDGPDAGAWLVSASPGTKGAAGEAGETRSRGMVIYMASAPTLGWTELPATPLMVPLVQEIVRQGVGLAGAGGLAVAGRTILSPPGATELELARAGEGAASEATAMNVGAGGAAGPARSRGLWRAVDRSGRTVGLVAVNADPEGGRTEAQPEQSVQQWLGGALGGEGDESASALARGALSWLDAEDAGASLRVAESGSPISFPMLAAALALALAEVVMARWFSHAKRESGAGAGMPALGTGGSA